MPAFSSAEQRNTQLVHWLKTFQAPYGIDFSRPATPVSSDAGVRRYYRLACQGPHGTSLIAADTPLPPQQNQAFVDIASQFEKAGVHAPRVFEADCQQGFMLMTDLGETTYLQALTALRHDPDTVPDTAQSLFTDAIDTLVRLQQINPASLKNGLPRYDAALMQRELALFPDWYIERHLGVAISPAMRAVLDTVFSTIIAHVSDVQPHVFVHRDFMPRNLMVGSPHKPNPGVIDFQDAVIGPVTYDLVSLFRDAFISWKEDFQRHFIQQYLTKAQKAGVPVNQSLDDFYQQYEWMGLQRHLKVLGIFARLKYRDGKPAYLEDAPRLLNYIRTVAQRYHALHPLIKVLDDIHHAAARH